MATFTLRVTPPEGKWDSWLAGTLASLDHANGAYLLVQEIDATRPHMHAIVTTSMARTTWVEFFKRHVGGTKRGDYSYILVKDQEKYERYLCKETPVKVLGRNGIRYSDQWIQDRHIEWVEQGEAYQKYLATKEAKKDKVPIVKQLTELCEAENLRTSEAVTRRYLRFVKDKNLSLNTHAAIAVVQGVMLQMDPQALEYYTGQIMSKLL